VIASKESLIVAHRSKVPSTVTAPDRHGGSPKTRSRGRSRRRR
jgi:hypothetical protein